MALWLHEVVDGVVAPTLLLDTSLTMSTVQLTFSFEAPKAQIQLLRQLPSLMHIWCLCTQNIPLQLLNLHESRYAHPFLYVSVNHSDLFEFDLVLFWPGFALVLPQPIAISWTWFSVSSHSSTCRSVRTNSFVCSSDFRVLLLTGIFRGNFLIICCILAADRKSASRSSTSSQCWAKCRHRISSLRCFILNCWCLQNFIDRIVLVPHVAVAPGAYKFRLIACPGFVVRVHCSRWTS